jgi:hypothetical protein
MKSSTPRVIRKGSTMPIPWFTGRCVAPSPAGSPPRRSDRFRTGRGPWRAAGLRFAAVAAGLGLLAALGAIAAPVDEEAAAIERRLAESAKYLASEELEGRGARTRGLDLAADYIAKQFEQAGLKTALIEGKPFQTFSITTAVDLGKENRLALTGPPAGEGQPPQTIELAVRKDYTPLALSGSGAFDAPLVFAGYGITAEAEKYDDYAGIDAAGKVVIVLRHEPQQDDPKSVFDGTRESPHAWMSRKVSNAIAHKAAAVIFCTDDTEISKKLADARKRLQEAQDRLAAEREKAKKTEAPAPPQPDAQRKRLDDLARQVEAQEKRVKDEEDPLLPLSHGGSQAKADFPVFHCRRAALDRAIRSALGTDLAQLEKAIDAGPKPQSRALPGWRAAGRADVRSEKAELKNVVAVKDGVGPRADETIVLGAHYDHLGLGGRGSLAGKKTIHFGADDNASGTAVLLEVARAMARRAGKLPRRVAFAAFTGEEIGLLGSARYVQEPPIPLDKTIAMLNFDMVGRLRDDRLSIIGTGTGKEFEKLLDAIGNPEGLKINRVRGGPGASDQSAFYARGIPVLHFYTGMHGEYHRPTDAFETLNVAGMRRIATLAERLVVALAEAPARPDYVKVASPTGMAFDPNAPVLGVVPGGPAGGGGVVLASVLEDGPASRAGLKADDVVTALGDDRIASVEDLLKALRKRKPGDTVKVGIRRAGEALSVDATLARRQAEGRP